MVKKYKTVRRELFFPPPMASDYKELELENKKPYYLTQKAGVTH